MKLEELRAQPHLSVNQIKTFLACPRKYFLQYVYKVEPAFRPVSLAFGSAFHETFGHWMVALKEGRPILSGELEQHFSDSLGSELASPGPPLMFEDDEDAERLIRLGQGMVKALVHAMPIPDRVLTVEWPFSIELVDPETGEVLEPPFIGAVDAVVETRGTPVAIELKTGKRRWSEDMRLWDLQPTAYKHALADGGHGDVEILLALVTKSDRPDVQFERLTRTQEDDVEFRSIVASVVRGIGAGVDHPVRSWRCKGCQFLEACR